MVKETVSGSSRETTIKKRRKAPTTETVAETDIYKKVISIEQTEACLRSPDDDAKLYCEMWKSFRNLLGEISELKSQMTSETPAKVAEKAMQASAYVGALKKLTLLEKARIVAAREALIVEKVNLLSELKKCKQFKSKYEEFLKEAPESKTKPFKNLDGLNDIQKHELHRARLEWELTQRKKLAGVCNTFKDEKKQVAADIIKSKNRLGGLAPKLAAVLESTKPLQDYLGLPIEKTYAEHKQASLLPNSLYLFYANADAYKKAYDIDMTLEILGDQDEAVQWKQLQSSHTIQIDESDHEADQQEVEESTEVKKRRHRKASHVDRQEERRKRLLEAHPLSVQVTIKIKEGPTLKITFNYRTGLNIITVSSEVDCPSNITGNTAREVLGGESVLGELFEGDFGTDSPNPSNPYQLRKVALSSYNSLVPDLGYAYLWAQKVCGLDFIASQSAKEAAEMSCTTVEIVMKTINKRLKSRTALATQLQQLEQNLIPNIPEDVDVPRNAVSGLTKWTSTTWHNFCSNPSTAGVVASEIVGPSDLFYSVTISRPNSGTLQALVAIKNDYPRQSPIFCLTVKHNGELHSGDCDEVRDMERAVNVGWSNKTGSASWLLAAQLQHLCAYFDVYLETAPSSSFPQNTVFFKSICGRNRR